MNGEPFILSKICSIFCLTRTPVRIILHIEQQFDKEEFEMMTGWSLFFVMVGVASLTAQLFRIIEVIERPAQRHGRRVMAR